MRYFSLETRPQSIPERWEDEATRLMKVSWKGRTVTGLNQAAYRSYIYPVLSPAEVPVTTERSIRDHPWHQSVTIGTDHFYVYQSSPDGKVEEPARNFYWDWPFQGRDAGRIISQAENEATELADDHLQITQRLNWEGPEEWGVPPHRRIMALEMRTIDVRPGETANIIDVRSRVRPTDWDLRIGPCRHSYFTVRVADHLRVSEPEGTRLTGMLVDSQGRIGAGEICWQHADWIDFYGTDAEGRTAGIALFQFPSLGNVPWYLVDYGSIRINPFRLDARYVNRGDLVDVAIRVVAHDGTPDEAGIVGLYASFKEEVGLK